MTKASLSGTVTRRAGDVAASPARRTYTGAPLERRKAWGREWGAVGKAIGEQIRREGR